MTALAKCAGKDCPQRDTFAEDNRRHTAATNKMMDDLVILRKRYERLSTASRQAYASAVLAINTRDAEAVTLKDSLRKECDDADDVCELLGLRSDTYRTEGGWLNIPHIRALLRERDEKQRADLAAAREDAERYREFIVQTAIRWSSNEPYTNEWFNATLGRGGVMSRPSDEGRCDLCGEPMPEGETMFRFHGYSGPCPKPPLPVATPTKTCVWAQEDESDLWATKCGHYFTINDGTPTDNKMRYCVFCGGTIDQVSSEQP